MKIKSGYTLIELIVALSLMVVVLLGGTALFTQNLRSGGMTDVDLNLNSSVRFIMDNLERSLRYGKVLSVDDKTRDNCLSLGADGYTGVNVSVEDVNGLVTEYSLMNSKIASTSALSGNVVYLNTDELIVNSLSVKWVCRSGISDKINLDINVSSSVLGSDVTISRSVSREILLLNSSTN